MASLSVDRPPPSSASSVTLNLSRLSLSPPIVSFPSSPTLPLNPLFLPTRRILTPIHALPKPNILLFPKKTKFRKQHRGKMKGKASRGNQISFGKFALQSLDCSWITARQLRAARMVLARYVKRFEGRGGKIWVRIFPDKSVTMRPSETRMGSGKGSPEFWVAVVKRDRIIFEIDGVPERVAREALTMAAFKLPIKTRFLVAEDEEEKKMIPAQPPLCSGGLPDVKPTAPVGV